MLLFTLLFLACKPVPEKKAPSFLPGIYVSLTQSEFSGVADTLTIHKMDLEGTAYQVSRKICFVRIKYGKSGAPEYQQEQWAAKYDPEKNTLTAADPSNLLIYVPNSNNLYKGNTEYDKIE